MLKVLYFTSETKKKFGVYKVVDVLKKKLRKKININLSYNVFDIFYFRPQVVHIHGCWRPHLFFAFLIAKITSKKVIISPHGMIDPFSFSQKKIKKKIAWFIYQKYVFNFSNLIIVNSKFEKKNLEKKLKIRKQILVIKHGISFNKSLINFKKKSNKLSFVFFSRIHPSKNLLMLIKLWDGDSFFKNYTLDIYGEIEDKKYFNRIKDIIFNLKNINFRGKITDNLSKKLSSYDIFVHPSESENFGLVILEAMSCGLFPIINKKLDWNILDKNNIGHSLNFTNKNLKKLILSLEKKKKMIRSQLFERKLKKFLINNYNWDIIINEYQKQYYKLINL